MGGDNDSVFNDRNYKYPGSAHLLRCTRRSDVGDPLRFR